MIENYSLIYISFTLWRYNMEKGLNLFHSICRWSKI